MKNSLLDELSSRHILLQAWQRVKKNKVCEGVDNVTIQDFDSRHGRELSIISDQLRKGKYIFDPARVKAIPKKPDSEETRDIHIYTIRDKIVQQALLTLFFPNGVKKPLFPEIFNKVALAYIPGKNGVKEAVDRTIINYKKGYVWLTALDIRDFFDNISRKDLQIKILSRLPDRTIDWIIQQTINQRVFPESEDKKERGVLQGAILSPFYSNIYLADFDKQLEKEKVLAVRYADDLALYTKSREEAQEKVAKIRHLLKKICGLEFYPDGSKKAPKIQDLNRYADYLGISYSRGPRKMLSISPSAACIKAEKAKVTDLLSDGRKSLIEKIMRANSSVLSWFTHYEKVGCHKSSLSSSARFINEHYCATVEHALYKIGIIEKTRKLTREQFQEFGVIKPSKLVK